MGQVNVCTVITRNRLAHARVLAESFLEHHPDGTVTALVLDDPDRSVGGECFETIRAGDLEIEGREFFRMAAAYRPLQLACAMKPWVLGHLLQTLGGAVVYLDGDIQVFDSLADVLPLASVHGLVLSPHATEPPPPQPPSDAEEGRLIGGVYNAGFLAVGPGAAPFLEWWRKRLARWCVQIPERGYYDDQRWLDLALAYFEHHVLRDPGVNVAFWNLQTRAVEWTGERYEVNGRPLRFFHFGGFEPEAPHWITRWRPTPAILLSERPAVARICREYARRLMEAGYRECSPLRYGFEALPNGMPFDRRMRELYRLALLAAEQDGQPEPPNPFADGADAFIAWLNEPSDRRGSVNRVSRYLLALREDDPELRLAFPNLLGKDAARYLDWAAGEGRRCRLVPDELVPQPEPAGAGAPIERPAALGPGVNLVFRSGGGGTLDEVARRIAAGLERAEIPFVEIGWLGQEREEGEAFTGVHPAAAPFDTSLVCLNPIDLMAFAFDVPGDVFSTRYSIGVWLDEETPVPDLDAALGFLDEVWVASEFAAAELAKHPGVEVLVVPMPVEPAGADPAGRADLGLPEGVLFLSIAPFGDEWIPGNPERDNPVAVIEAFERAFRPGEGAQLLLRTEAGERRLDELERLRLSGDRPDIRIVDGPPLSPTERRALISACDCYVSLHRVVELGIAAAEAMAAGKPVIATAYSGNLQFMDEGNGYLVGCGTTPMPAEYASYWCGEEWADPDLGEAARLLRRVNEHRDEARAIGERARASMRARHSLDSTAAFVEARLGKIRARVPRPAPASQAPAPARPPTPLERAAAYLSHGPENSWDTPARLGVVGAIYRRALLRLLRPYTSRQAELDAAVVGALHELARRQAETAARAAELAGEPPDGR